MADLILVATLAAWLFFVFCVWQALRLIGGWRPATARVLRSDYTEAQQREDFWSFGMTMFTSRGWNWRDGEDSRLIEDDVEFTTADGHMQRAVVRRQVHRGWRPSLYYPVWYDTADPARVTVLGPWFWGLMAVLALMVTISLARTAAASGVLAHLFA
jgi:hypothetical protein